MTYLQFESEILRLITAAGGKLRIYIPQESHVFVPMLIGSLKNRNLAFEKIGSYLTYTP